MADYLNRTPDLQGIALMFSREAEGIYRFGTKRILVKVEMEKLISMNA